MQLNSLIRPLRNIPARFLQRILPPMLILRMTPVIHIIPEIRINLLPHTLREPMHFATILVAKIVALARLAEVVGPWYAVWGV